MRELIWELLNNQNFMTDKADLIEAQEKGRQEKSGTLSMLRAWSLNKTVWPSKVNTLILSGRVPVTDWIKKCILPVCYILTSAAFDSKLSNGMSGFNRNDRPESVGIRTQWGYGKFGHLPFYFPNLFGKLSWSNLFLLSNDESPKKTNEQTFCVCVP